MKHQRLFVDWARGSCYRCSHEFCNGIHNEAYSPTAQKEYNVPLAPRLFIKSFSFRIASSVVSYELFLRSVPVLLPLPLTWLRVCWF